MIFRYSWFKTMKYPPKKTLIRNISTKTEHNMCIHTYTCQTIMCPLFSCFVCYGGYVGLVESFQTWAKWDACYIVTMKKYERVNIHELTGDVVSYLFLGVCTGVHILYIYILWFPSMMPTPFQQGSPFVERILFDDPIWPSCKQLGDNWVINTKKNLGDKQMITMVIFSIYLW